MYMWDSLHLSSLPSCIFMCNQSSLSVFITHVMCSSTRFILCSRLGPFYSSIADPLYVLIVVPFTLFIIVQQLKHHRHKVLLHMLVFSWTGKCRHSSSLIRGFIMYVSHLDSQDVSVVVCDWWHPTCGCWDWLCCEVTQQSTTLFSHVFSRLLPSLGDLFWCEN